MNKSTLQRGGRGFNRYSHPPRKKYLVAKVKLNLDHAVRVSFVYDCSINFSCSKIALKPFLC